MGTILKNVVRFTGLVVGVPVALPHRLNVNGIPVAPRIGGANNACFTITANTINVTATRTADAGPDVDVYVEFWHSIEAVVPLVPAPGQLAGLVPLFFASCGGGGGGAPIVEHFSGDGSVDPPIVVNPVDDAVFVQNIAGETVLDFTLADSTVDGHVISFKTVGSTNNNVCTITPANFDPEEAGLTISIGNSGSAGFSLIWNASEGYWQILGTPRNATIA